MNDEWNDREMLIAVPFDPYSVIDHLYRNATYDQIMEFIITIDETIGEWDFTQLIIDYAKGQKKILKAEKRESY